MKTKLLILILILSTALWTACEKVEEEPTLTVNSQSLQFDSEGGTQTIKVTANYPWTTTVSGSGLTLNLSPSSGNGDETVTVTASATQSLEDLTGSIIFKCKSLSKSVSVNQKAKGEFTGLENTYDAPAAGGNFEVDVRYNTDLKVEVDADVAWLRYVTTRSLKDGKIQFAIDPNLSPKRSAKVTVRDVKGKLDPKTLFIQQAESPDRTVMMDLYRSLGGTSLTNMDGWGTDKPLDQWKGVDVTGVRVSTIKIENPLNDQGEVMNLNNVNGTIPVSIGDLTELTWLEFRNLDGLHGRLPASIGNLKKLGALIIGKTSLEGPLPDVFGTLPSFWNLSCWKNPKLGGPLPRSLGNCENVKEIYMSDCAFTGSIPEEWCKGGRKIHVSSNQLSGLIPAAFFAMPNAARNFNKSCYQTKGSLLDASNASKLPGYFYSEDPENANFFPGGYMNDLDGSKFRYKDVISSARVTVEINWTSWCPFSKQFMPILLEYYKKYHSKGLEIIAMNFGEGHDQNLSHAEIDALVWKEIKAKGYDVWHNISFDKNKILSYVPTVPTANVYDKDGNIIYTSIHRFKDSYGRSGVSAGTELIPFLEKILGPLDDPDYYESKDFSEDGKVLTLQKASMGKGINIVLMGDGYTDRDMNTDGLYEKLMRQSMEQFFAIEPYKTFRNRFNVYAVKAVSSNGQIGNGYNTAFSTVPGTGEFIGGNNEKVFEYALKVPAISSKKDLLVMVIANEQASHGCAFLYYQDNASISYVGSLRNDAEGFGSTLRHEAGGHGFAFLGDEYVWHNGMSPSANEIATNREQYAGKGWWANVDFTNDPKTIRWSWFLNDARYKSLVGIYEGAYTFEKGAYRPSENSMMRENFEWFNAPSRQVIYKRIMELSGEEYSLEKFIEYDAVNRVKARSGGVPSTNGPKVRGHAPIVIK